MCAEHEFVSRSTSHWARLVLTVIQDYWYKVQALQITSVKRH